MRSSASTAYLPPLSSPLMTLIDEFSRRYLAIHVAAVLTPLYRALAAAGDFSG
jgi:hypothetical protein